MERKKEWRRKRERMTYRESENKENNGGQKNKTQKHGEIE
jgi:hypothetical protein